MADCVDIKFTVTLGKRIIEFLNTPKKNNLSNEDYSREFITTLYNVIEDIGNDYVYDTGENRADWFEQFIDIKVATTILNSNIYSLNDRTSDIYKNSSILSDYLNRPE